MSAQRSKRDRSISQLRGEVKRRAAQLGYEVDVTGYTTAELLVMRTLLMKVDRRQQRDNARQQRRLEGCNFSHPLAACYGQDPLEIICGERAVRPAF
ncbi:MAG TPA: hypothetical protein VK963_00470 [Candidatus Saccharimonadales bacterium]|nr:hypothetical protein [Candidatus Saccharimonadales bacterium]